MVKKIFFTIIAINAVMIVFANENNENKELEPSNKTKSLYTRPVKLSEVLILAFNKKELAIIEKNKTVVIYQPTFKSARIKPSIKKEKMDTNKEN